MTNSVPPEAFGCLSNHGNGRGGMKKTDSLEERRFKTQESYSPMMTKSRYCDGEFESDDPLS